MPGKKLIVIGDGPEFSHIQAIAKSNIQLMGFQPFEVLKDRMQKGKAFIFAAEEDFGITPVEAQACGTPVIAYGKGGVLETVQNGEQATGVLFEEQTTEAIIEAVKEFEDNKASFDYYRCRLNAEKFSVENFKKQFSQYCQEKWTEFALELQ